MSISYPFKPMGGWHELPAGYRECEYLESDSTSWIDTELKLTNNNSVYVTLRYNSLTIPVNDGGFAYGYRTSYGGSDGHCFILNGAAGAFFTYGRSEAINVGDIWKDGDLVICNTKEEGYIQYTDTSGYDYKIHIRGAYSGGDFSTVGTAYLFALNTPGGDVRRMCGRVYDYKVIDNNTQESAQHLIPCLDTNSVPCMYDTISGKTFYNQGTGTFNYKLK